MARGTFGERLKRERELREVTLAEITSATRIGPRFLEALENEDWSKLPGGVFNRGFVRSIARYLGLDEESLLGEYDLAHGAQAAEVAPKPESRIPSPPKWIPIAVFAAALLIFAGLVFGGIRAWKWYAARRAAKSAALSLTATPSPPATPAALLAPSSTPNALPSAPPIPLDLTVAASAPVHLTILADGKPHFDQTLQPGENHHFAASDQLEVTASDSGAVLLELNGQALPPLGVPGSSGKMLYSHKDLKQDTRGSSKP